MPVPPLDLKAIWNSGAAYDAWLAGTTNKHMLREMEEFFKQLEIPKAAADAIRNLKRDVPVLALIEDWCGDVRRNAPVLAALCALNPARLKLRCVDKATRPELMVRYLTNAAEAIPIFIFFNADFVEIGNWGPRPAECKRLIARGKAAGKIDDAREKIHGFYAADNNQSTIKELLALIDIASADGV